jgi:hypothetical protein
MLSGTSSPVWPADSPAVMAHINLLQGIINRLANNSACCKTWCLALVGALLSLAGATHPPVVVYFTTGWREGPLPQIDPKSHIDPETINFSLPRSGSVAPPRSL